MVFGTELSTPWGHLVALNVPQGLTPAERNGDPIGWIRSRGGLAIVAHPIQHRNPWRNPAAAKAARGYELSQDDEIRRHVITELMCNFRLDLTEVERRFDIVFSEYFAAELASLTAESGSPLADGLVSVQRDRIEVEPVGRMFVRNVCMVFDKYLAARTGGSKPVFSRTV